MYRVVLGKLLNSWMQYIGTLTAVFVISTPSTREPDGHLAWTRTSWGHRIFPSGAGTRWSESGVVVGRVVAVDI